jgi:two-component system cell cycle sensor histidine kinase/response regulator CckA
MVDHTNITNENREVQDEIKNSYKNFIANIDQVQHQMNNILGSAKAMLSLYINNKDVASTKEYDINYIYDFIMTSLEEMQEATNGLSKLKEYENSDKMINIKSETTSSRIAVMEAVSTLAAGIAHDFNNILTGILGNIALAKMDLKPGDKSFENLARAERASLQARSLARQLLTFSKGGSLIKKTTSISELVKDTTMLALRGSKVVCRFSIPDDLWLVDIDEGQISQVINNIVINARQAMSEGGIMQIGVKNTSISPKQHLPLKEGRYVKISIKDQGMGIPDEYLEKIFEPFFTTKNKGTGLGLSTSYSVIKKHNGHITVESKVGIGTKFHIFLPASDESSAITVDEEKAFRGKGKILVMDDQKMVRDTVGSMLKRIGFEHVEFARDGQEAIGLYRKAMKSSEPFDVIIVDLTIPGGMGGQEVINELCKIDPDVKAIVSSGYTTAPILSNPEKYAFKSALIKPYNIIQLSQVMKKVLSK